MNIDDPAFDHSTFTKNRDHVGEHDVAGQLFAAVVDQARGGGLLSSEHFTVDGTLIEAWASLKSFRAEDEEPEDRDPPDDPGNPPVNFHGENEATRRTRRPPTQQRGWPARATAWRPSSASRRTR